MTDETKMSKAELLANIETGWNNFQQYLSTLTYEQATLPTDTAGWTVKDHLVHVAVWEESLNALLDKQPRWESMGVDRALFESTDWDKVNAVIQQRYHDLSLAELRRRWLDTHARLIAKIKAMSDADLQRSYREFQPEAAWDAPIIHWAIIETYGHYDEHQDYIERIASQHPVTVANLLDAIQRGWDEFYAYLDTLSEAQITQLADAVGWTVKDHVDHIAAWEDAMNALLDKRSIAAALNVDQALLDSDDIDAQNAVIQQRDRALSWAEVRQRHADIHQRLIGKIAALTDADLLRPYRDYAPEAHEPDDVLAHLVSNTVGHYAEHRPWIEAIVASEFSKAQLLAAMQRGWDDLNAYLDTLSEAQVTQPTDAGGWTAKDHVIHLAVWEGSMNDFLQKRPRWEYMGVDRATWENDRPHGVNAVIQRRNKDLAWAQVREQFRLAHQELIGRVEALSEADLQRPYNYYQPGSDMTDTAAHRLSVATYHHYAEHIPWIQAIVAAPPATSKTEVLATMQRGWDEFNAYLDALSEAQMTLPHDAAGWTAKDHVIHLAVWEDSMNALLAGQDRLESMGVDDRAAWERGDWDAINAVIYRHNKDLSLAEVRQRFRQVHERLIATIQALPDEDLQRPYNHYQPNSTHTGPVINSLVGNTSAHYAEHRPWIEAIVRS